MTRTIFKLWYDKTADANTSEIKRCRTLEDVKRIAIKLMKEGKAVRVQIKEIVKRQEGITGIWLLVKSRSYDLWEDDSWHKDDWVREA